MGLLNLYAEILLSPVKLKSPEPVFMKLGMYNDGRLGGLVVRVPGYRTEMYCFPVRYELNLYILYRRK
jgi:hypothetical protein